MSSPSSAKDPTGDLRTSLRYRRAVEATIWGIPAVSMAAIRRSLPRDFGADFGDIVYFSQVMEPRHELLTANNQTPYVVTVLDLRQGPMVIEVPPATDKVSFFGSAIDSWEVPLADLGPSGDDAGKGGKYLFLPPEFTETPPDGYFVVPSATYFVHTALRPIASATGTLADAVAYSQTLKVYPLASSESPPVNRYIDAYPKAWHTLPPFNLDYFHLLAETIAIEPLQPKDAAMLGMVASLGIAKGQAFAPDDATAALLAQAAQEGAADMDDAFMNQYLAPFWPDRQWQSARPDDTFGYSFYGDGRLDYDRRAGAFAYWATWAPKRLADPSKLPATFYLETFRDGFGALFRGDQTYRLRVPADTPAHDFWSIIAYENGTNAFIHNPENRVGLSSYDREAFTLNDDGSVDLFVGPAAPAGLTPNWIPTAGKGFWLMMRFYGPGARLFNASWTMPDVELLAAG